MSGQNNADNAESEAIALNQNDGDSEIPIVSLSELLEENDDIFSPIGDLSANFFASPSEVDGGAANTVLATLKEKPVSRAESDDDFEFVGNDAQVDVVAEKSTTILAKAVEPTTEPTSTLFDELKGDSDNVKIPSSETLAPLPATPAEEIAVQSESKDSDKAEAGAPDKGTARISLDDIILLDDDDEDSDKMDVDKVQEESVISPSCEKAIEEDITPTEEINKDKDGEKSESPEVQATPSNNDNDGLEENEKIDETKADSSPSNTSGDDVIMLDEEDSGEKSKKPTEETNKGKQRIYEIY